VCFVYCGVGLFVKIAKGVGINFGLSAVNEVTSLVRNVTVAIDEFKNDVDRANDHEGLLRALQRTVKTKQQTTKQRIERINHFQVSKRPSFAIKQQH
jgi:hypothetical protein